jgi:hypothetical protein
MDHNSVGVFTTLGLDFLGAIVIGIVWLLIRWCRGDKKKSAGVVEDGVLRNQDLD